MLEPLGVELVLAPDHRRGDAGRAGRRTPTRCSSASRRSPSAVVEAAADGGCRVIARYGIGYDNIDVDGGDRARHPRHQRAGLLPRRGRRPRDGAAARGRRAASCRRRCAVGAGGWAVPHEAVHRLARPAARADRRRAASAAGSSSGRAAFGFEVVGFDPYVDDRGRSRPSARRHARGGGRRGRLRLAARAADRGEPPPDRRGLDRADAARAGRSSTPRAGRLVDLDAAVAALDDGRLGGVALDVTEPEPPPADHPLRTHPRAIVTPHMAFYSVEAQDELQQRAAEEVARALDRRAAGPSRQPRGPGGG